MGAFIKALVLTAVLGYVIILISNKIDNDRHTNITVTPHKVTALGQCNKTECSIMYSDVDSTGTSFPGTVDSPVVIGQIVYRECWTSKSEGNMCYTRFTTTRPDL